MRWGKIDVDNHQKSIAGKLRGRRTGHTYSRSLELIQQAEAAHLAGADPLLFVVMVPSHDRIRNVIRTLHKAWDDYHFGEAAKGPLSYSMARGVVYLYDSKLVFRTSEIQLTGMRPDLILED